MATRRQVLFLCTGDICRGPMAAGLLRKLLDDAGIKSIEVRSAGVMTVPGLLATAESKQMLESAGVELRRHLSTPMSLDLLRKSDLILGMTPLHVQQALRLDPPARAKIQLLKEYTRSDVKKVQIEDPMGNTLEVYKRVFKEIRLACQRLVKMPFFTGQKPEEADAAPSTAKRAGSKGTARRRTTAAKRKSTGKTVPATKSSKKKKPAAKPATKPAAKKTRSKSAAKSG